MTRWITWCLSIVTGVALGAVVGWIVQAVVQYVSMDHVYVSPQSLTSTGARGGLFAGAFVGACAVVTDVPSARRRRLIAEMSLACVLAFVGGVIVACVVAGLPALGTLVVEEPSLPVSRRFIFCHGLYRGVSIASAMATLLIGWRIVRYRRLAVADDA